MSDFEKKIVKVLKGLDNCGKFREALEDCGDCPYQDPEDDFCVTRLSRDAYSVIVCLDKLIQQRGGTATRGIGLDQKILKALKGLLRCGVAPEAKEECGECPYITESDACIAGMCREARDVILALWGEVERMGRGG